MPVPEVVRVRRVGTPSREPRRKPHIVGPVSFTWQNGAIRHLSVDGIEVLRGIGAVIRDGNWGTHALCTEEDITQRCASAIEFTYRAVVSTDSASPQDSPLELDMHARVDDAELDMRLAMTARERFVTCRSGLSVLLPLAGVVGSETEVAHSDGTTEMGRFPQHISPGQPFFDIRRLSFAPVPQRTIDLRFDGDVFEMEDQRNWSDASFKIYNRPLALPAPYTIETGETVTHRVRLQWHDDPAGARR